MEPSIEGIRSAFGARYRVLREIGAGGMAVVYLADDMKHHRQVAIKVLRRDLAAGVGPERFLAEIRTTAALSHAHIIPLFDSGDADGQLFFVMPFVEGESLRDRLKREGALPLDDALHLAREIADALGYAHERHVIHRDIKPENILLSHGHAYVADFGIARALSAAGATGVTQTGVAIGTPAYMSPEQAFGEHDVDERTDLYSLACVTYEMIVGAPPFDGPTPQAILAQRLTAHAPRMSTRRAGVPTAIDAAVHRALARTADERFPAVSHFVDALARESPPAAISGPSIAVLPFSSMNADAGDDYFADGITEEIINALTQLNGLRVVPRTSCFAFKGKTEDLRVIADKLGVGTLLQGSVRKAGARLRVTAQLINAADGYHLWSERYDCELLDVFAIQDEIAGAIAAKLRIALLPQPSSVPARAAPDNFEAYDLLLKGRSLYLRRGPSLVESVAYFERAVALDPGLREAHAMLGDTYRLLALYGIVPARESISVARGAVERALALDPRDVDALATLANIVAIHDWDIAASVAMTERALALDPRHVRALCERAISLACTELSPEQEKRAFADLRIARDIDPLNAWAAAIDAFCLSLTGRDDEAIAQAHHALELDPQNFTARWSLVVAQSGAGHHDEALAATAPALVMSGRHPQILAAVAAIHAARNEIGAADAIYQELCSRARGSFVSSSTRGAAAAAAGRFDEARSHLARAVDERDPFLAFWKLATWAPARSDPEASCLLRASGFGSPAGRSAR